ncbi:1-acyl-sn-glycerol-3-phosphate acyltransferase [Lyngbya aestuarii]|uniref:1-acyl-sn-glycerol-3-phosphate acyltransferase n=1 Tax=Lyngbya aestuarii TaxID=118322 RepID=UPI00403DDED5
MSTQSPEEQIQQNAPQPLTPAKIERVKEGVAAARDSRVRQAIEEALSNTDAIAEAGSERRVSGWLRRCLLRSLMHSLFCVRVEFPERIPQEPAMLAANHLNHIDPFLILSEVPAHPYYYIPGDARTLYNHWWKRRILGHSGGVIPLERRWGEEKAVIEQAQAGHQDLADLAAAVEQDVPTGGDIHTLRRIDRATQAIFGRGDGIIIFPEGKLGHIEGQLELPLARGAVLYALRAGVPIVPVALIGVHDLYFRKKLTIRFGKPLRFPRSKRPKPRAVAEAVEALEDSLMALLPGDYQEPSEPKPLRYFLNHMFW